MLTLKGPERHLKTKKMSFSCGLWHCRSSGTLSGPSTSMAPHKALPCFQGCSGKLELLWADSWERSPNPNQFTLFPGHHNVGKGISRVPRVRGCVTAVSRGQSCHCHSLGAGCPKNGDFVVEKLQGFHSSHLIHQSWAVLSLSGRGGTSRSCR